MGIKIGLDVGITSVGYAVLRTDDEGVPYKIEILNSVIFPAAENPKSGESLAHEALVYSSWFTDGRGN